MAGVRLANPGDEWRPGRDYDIVERINRPRGDADRGEGATSVVFRIRKDGKDYVLKMIAHSIGTIDDLVQAIAAERFKRGEPFGVRPGDRAEARRRQEYRNTDEALVEKLGGEWQEISRLMMERPHQNLAPVLHWYHSDTPSLRERDPYGYYVPGAPLCSLCQSFSRTALSRPRGADAATREAVANRTLFMVMTRYPHGSLLSFMKTHGLGDPGRLGDDFYGLGTVSV